MKNLKTPHIRNLIRNFSVPFLALLITSCGEGWHVGFPVPTSSTPAKSTDGSTSPGGAGRTPVNSADLAVDEAKLRLGLADGNFPKEFVKFSIDTKVNCEVRKKTSNVNAEDNDYSVKFVKKNAQAAPESFAFEFSRASETFKGQGSLTVDLKLPEAPEDFVYSFEGICLVSYEVANDVLSARLTNCSLKSPDLTAKRQGEGAFKCRLVRR